MTDFHYSMLHEVAHRPWPMPNRPWALRQSWRTVLFAHWRLPPRVLTAHIPPPLELDTFEGSAWLGVVAFQMADIALRELPAVPWVSTFPEINVRTYVQFENRSGIYFFSLDAPSVMAVALGRLLNLNYFASTSELTASGERHHFRNDRSSAHPPARFDGRYRPTGEPFVAAPGTLDHWLTERYCLFTVHKSGKTEQLDVHHAAWTLSRAEATITVNSMADPLGIGLPAEQPLLHYSQRQDTVAWLPAEA
jgi:uncharacterized protein YqjF (DUF2071 family)